MMLWQTHLESSGSPLLSGKSVRYHLQKAVLSQVYLCFCIRSEGYNCKEACILCVYSVLHVSKSLLEHYLLKYKEKRGSQYTRPLDTVCYSKCIRDLPSIPYVHHHSGIQTFYRGCELFGASIFPQQLPQSSPPYGVECIREVDKDNIQRSILLHAIFL